MKDIVNTALANLHRENFVEFSDAILQMKPQELTQTRVALQKEKLAVHLLGPEAARQFKRFKVGEAIVAQEYAARERCEEIRKEQRTAIFTPLSEDQVKSLTEGLSEEERKKLIYGF